MCSASTTDRRRPGRKPTDPQVIIDALERLLATKPLRELNVEDILQEAGVSRATFYACFPTKFAATAALFSRVSGEVVGASSAFLTPAHDETPIQSLRRGVDASVEVWSRHRDILTTVFENEHAEPELAASLAHVKLRFAESIAERVGRQRAEGLAPQGYETVELCTALVECTFTLVYRSSIDPDPRRRLNVGTVDLITTLWCGAIYRQLPSLPGLGARSARTTAPGTPE